MVLQGESNFSSFHLCNILIQRASTGKWSLRVEIGSPQSYPTLSMYVELYDSEGNVVAAVFLDDVEVKGTEMIGVDIPLQRIEGLHKARVSLYSNYKELWSAEVRITEQSY